MSMKYFMWFVNFQEEDKDFKDEESEPDNSSELDSDFEDPDKIEVPGTT